MWWTSGIETDRGEKNNLALDKNSHEISETVKQLQTFNNLYSSQYLAVWLYR